MRGFTRKRAERQAFPEHLPRERVVIDPPTSCECCGGHRLRKLGEDVTRTLECVPRQWKVVETVREKFSCRDCEKISQAPAPFHDDLLAFVEEKIGEAIADPASQIAATQEAAGAMPIIGDRLREDDVLWTKFVLVLGTKIEARYWREWRDQFARMERAEFLSESGRFVGPDGILTILRTVLRQ